MGFLYVEAYERIRIRSLPCLVLGSLDQGRDFLRVNKIWARLCLGQRNSIASSTSKAIARFLLIQTVGLIMLVHDQSNGWCDSGWLEIRTNTCMHTRWGHYLLWVGWVNLRWATAHTAHANGLWWWVLIRFPSTHSIMACAFGQEELQGNETWLWKRGTIFMIWI